MNVPASELCNRNDLEALFYSSVSQLPGRRPVPGPGINYTGLQEVLLEFVIFGDQNGIC
jgi:hypothetical protein